MIRKCTHDDLDFLLDKATAFWKRIQPDRVLNRYKVEQLFSKIISHDVMLRSEDGFIAGVFIEDPFFDYTALAEIAWYCDDGHGLRLLRAFEKAGKEAGVSEIRMATLAALPEAERLVRNRYNPIDTTWGLHVGD